ncbi:MAG TPA: molybdopterin dehydrogenase [candidate division Zixibacteria bacterium]|nr:molybdopterin dehydrogenase [candidate division Zixibacteria bacterium]
MIALSAYRQPDMLNEALEILSSGDFAPIAGGTDLIPQLRCGQQRKLLDISRLGLSFIKKDDNFIEIGAACTHSRLSSDDLIKEKLPLLFRATGLVGSWQIRNRGTVGGNIINASPCADSVPALLNYDAELVLLSQKGRRAVKLNEFTLGPYKTQIKPDELLYSIRCKKQSTPSGCSYLKLGRRQAVNISRMTLAATIAKDKNDVITNATIAGGSIFPAPSRMPEIEKMLNRQKVSYELFEDAANLAADLMIKESGVRWSTPYKKPVLIGLVQRALCEASGINAS